MAETPLETREAAIMAAWDAYNAVATPAAATRDAAVGAAYRAYFAAVRDAKSRA